MDDGPEAVKGCLVAKNAAGKTALDLATEADKGKVSAYLSPLTAEAIAALPPPPPPARETTNHWRNLRRLSRVSSAAGAFEKSAGVESSHSHEKVSFANILSRETLNPFSWFKSLANAGEELVRSFTRGRESFTRSSSRLGRSFTRKSSSHQVLAASTVLSAESTEQDSV